MIPLEPGDIVVGVAPMRDFILVFTQGGAVYRVTYRDDKPWDGCFVEVEKLP